MLNHRDVIACAELRVFVESRLALQTLTSLEVGELAVRWKRYTFAFQVGIEVSLALFTARVERLEAVGIRILAYLILIRLKAWMTF
jgi:hypothetical protein